VHNIGQVDLATVMAEMFHVGDKDKNEKLEQQEFIKGMLEHPVTNKILRIKKIGKIISRYSNK
jgi:hypothetical protein